MRITVAALLTLACATPTWAQPYTVKTFAGGSLPENQRAATASLGAIYGVALDRAGLLYLSLGDYNIVVRMDPATGILTRVAGNGSAGYSGDGADALNARLNAPAGLAVDSSGNVYIADANNYRVRVVRNGIISTLAGNGTQGYSGDGGPAISAQFNGVSDVAVDTAGAVYVADFYNHAVRKIAAGTITTLAGNGTYGYSGDTGPAFKALLAGPSGVAIDANGTLYIAEAYNNRVRRVASGVITTAAGGTVAGFNGDQAPASTALLNQPSGVAVDQNGVVYIADTGNNRVRIISNGGFANGGIVTVAGNGKSASSGDGGLAVSAGLASPQRLAVDSRGNVYIAEADHIRKVTSGTIATIAGGAPAPLAQLQTPRGVALDANGALYVADPGTNRVLKIAANTITQVPGTGTTNPVDLAIDAAGDLYIADSQNARIRKLSKSVLTTLAGGGTILGDNGPATGAQLTLPQSVAVDASGRVYFSDQNRVRVLSGGQINTFAGNGALGYQGDGALATAARISSPTGIAADSAGNVYIADTGNSRVRVVNNGVINTAAGNGTNGISNGGGTATSAQLSAPAGVAVDTAGNLFITDSYRVLKVTKGKISTIAGLSSPQGIATGPAGNLYVAEAGSHRIVMLTPGGSNCPISTAPAAPLFQANGGNLPMAIQTGDSCSWAVENLPAWLTLADNSYGAGAGVATLAASPNTGAPRTATIVVGGASVTVAQAGTLTIAGQITLPSGTPLPGVAVALGTTFPVSVPTDSGGNFSFTNLNSTGSYVITPTLAGYAFVPATLTIANATANPAVTFTAYPLPKINGLGPVFGSSLQPAPKSWAAGEIVSIYGSSFCSDPVSAAPTLPDRLGACFVQLDGVNLRVYYASATQINIVLPQTLAIGDHQLVVQRYTDTGYKQLATQSATFPIIVARTSLAMLERTESGASILLAQFPDGGLAGQFRPVKSGDTLVLYLTGLGRKAQTFAEGAAPKVASAAVETVQVQIQGITAQVLYAGAQPQYPGLDQITLQLPSYTLELGKTTAAITITSPATGQVLRYDLAAQ